MRWLTYLNRRYLLRYRAEYALAIFLLHCGRGLSPRFAWLLARLIGELSFRVGVRRRILERNLSIAFPEKSREERLEIGRLMFRHFASMVVDIMFQRRMVRKSNFYDRFRFTGWARDYLEKHGEEGLLRRATRVMFVTAHFGNWELASGFFSLLGVRIAPVFRSPQNPFLASLIRGIRLDSQFDVIERRGAVQAMIERLDAGGNIGFLFDQEAAYGLYAPFFGKPACTHKTPAVLVRDYGVKVFFGTMVRRGDFLDYEVRGELIDLRETLGDRAEDLEAIVAELLRRLEEEIRSVPEQYLWTHRRWKRSLPQE